MADSEKPHFIDRGRGLEAASIDELAPLIVQHAAHDGIAYFENCREFVEAREAGRYPQWFPPHERSSEQRR